jgi:hypothetical protein
MAPRRATVCLLLAALVCAATATVFLEEKFDDGAPCPLSGAARGWATCRTGLCSGGRHLSRPRRAGRITARIAVPPPSGCSGWLSLRVLCPKQGGAAVDGGAFECPSLISPVWRPPPAPGAAWEKRWVKSSWKVKDGTAGDWTLTPGKWFGDAKADAGIQTGPDARFFAIAAPFKKPVDTDGKTLVVQVSGRQPGGCGLAQAGWCQIWPLVVARATEQSVLAAQRATTRA